MSVTGPLGRTFAMSNSFRAGRAREPGSTTSSGCEQRMTISRSEATRVSPGPPVGPAFGPGVRRGCDRIGIVCRRSATPWIRDRIPSNWSRSTVKFIVTLFFFLILKKIVVAVEDVNLWIAYGRSYSPSGKRERNLRAILTALRRNPGKNDPSAIHPQGYPLIALRSASMLFLNDTSSFVFILIIFTAYMTVH